jgi:NADH:ubiquinone reductase (non-electrogenic)
MSLSKSAGRSFRRFASVVGNAPGPNPAVNLTRPTFVAIKDLTKEQHRSWLALAGLLGTGAFAIVDTSSGTSCETVACDTAERSTFSGVQDLASQYGKTGLVLGGLFGSVALVSRVAFFALGGFLASAHVADLAVNNDLDDLTTLPSYVWHLIRGPATNRKKVVVLGSGWGALAMVRKLDPMEFDVTIVSPRTYFFYTPMLAGVTTGTVKAHSVLEPVRQTNPMPYATFMKAEATDVDAERRVLGVQDAETRIEIPYDHLVVAVGAQPNTFGIPGVQENAMFLKELNHGTDVRARILNRLEQAAIAYRAGHHEDVSRLLSIAVVGGGPTGVEFSAELADFIKTDVKRSFPTIADKLKVTLIEALPQVLPMFSKEIATNVKNHLESAGVDVRTETMVKGVDEHSITLANKAGDKTTLDYGVMVWVAGIGARPISKKLGAAFGQSNPRGIEVDGFLRIKGAPEGEVFAMGDCALSGKPPTAQVASQQGKYLARAFRDEGAKAKLPFAYDHQGTMAYVGQAQAVAVLASPDFATGGSTQFAFWRSLSSCPDELLKPEHRSGTSPNPDAKKDDNNVTVTGIAGFGVWRGVYYAKLFHYQTRYNVAIDWIRNIFFGRVVSDSAVSSR